MVSGKEQPINMQCDVYGGSAWLSGTCGGPFFIFFYLLFICIMHNNQWWFGWAFVVTMYSLLHSFIYCIDKWKLRFNQGYKWTWQTKWKSKLRTPLDCSYNQPSKCTASKPTHLLIIQCIKRKLGCSTIHYKSSHPLILG